MSHYPSIHNYPDFGEGVLVISAGNHQILGVGHHEIVFPIRSYNHHLVSLSQFLVLKLFGLAFSETIPSLLTYLSIASIITRGLYLLFRKRSSAGKYITCVDFVVCYDQNCLISGDNIMDYIMSSVILLSTLLLRAHNIWPLVFNLFLYWSIFRRLWPIVGEDSASNMQLGKIVLRTTLCYWFGQMSYFSTVSRAAYYSNFS